MNTNINIQSADRNAPQSVGKVRIKVSAAMPPASAPVIGKITTQLPIGIGSQGWDDPCEWLIEGLIPNRAVGFAYGASQDLKTFTLVQMSYCLSVGMPFGSLGVKKGKVIYVAGESPASIPRRLRAVEDKNGVPLHGNLLVVKKPVNLSEPDQYAELEKVIVEFNNATPGEVVLVVIDTFSQCSAGIDENNAGDIAKYINACTRLANEYSLTVLNVHHTGKSGDYRGSSAIFGNVDFVLSTRRYKSSGVLATDLAVEKSKDSSTDLAYRVGFEVVSLGLEDNMGNEITSLVVESIEPTKVSKKNVSADLKGQQLLHEIFMSEEEKWVSQKELIELWQQRTTDSGSTAKKKISRYTSALTEDGILIEDLNCGRSKRYRLITGQSLENSKPH